MKSAPARRNILVTGVAGFVGSNLADRLIAEGYNVRGLDDLSAGVIEQVPSGVEFHRRDIRSPDIYPLFENIDAVFHLAAKNCISDCQADPVETASINVSGTVNVLEACRRAGVPRFIYAESSAVYEGTQLFPTPETEEQPRSFYAASKMSTRYFAEAYERFHGLRTTALRYFCVYGPRQDYRRTVPPVMSAFIISLLQGRRPTIFGTGDKRRDFVYVDDVNDFHLLCLEESRTEGRVFNLGSGHSYSVREIFDTVREIVGGDIEPEYAPDMPGEAVITQADISAARSVGWTPRVSLRDGLDRSVRYIEEQVLRSVEVA